MDALHLRILPVYSEYHPTAVLGSKRLLKHQVETLEAFECADVDVIINTAMTGDGKSLAAYYPAFQKQQNVIAMYPTNELVQDQCNALPKYSQDLQVRLARYETMYSDRISQLMREHDETVRLREVRKLLMHSGILLTNPDLIHLILSHQYGWDSMRKELPVLVGAQFAYLLFDEFHVFGVPQTISVINMLGYLTAYYRDKPGDRKKYIFLSATPSPLLNRLVLNSGLRSRLIQGSYNSTAHTTTHRCILQPCEIELHEVNQDAPTERWVEEHLEDMQHFFQQHPGSKAAILVSSVATARRLVAKLEAYFKPYGITVGENTGLTDLEKRKDSLSKHILVGTSTVDVGIDFHINYLIFEASSAGNFLQRFGRLGRHDEFFAYRAYALVPGFVLERLNSKIAAEGEVERERFNEVVREVFPTEQEFAAYTKLWGRVQAAHVLEELRMRNRQDANDAFAEALTGQYEHIYGAQGKAVMRGAQKKYRGLQHACPEILKELLSFRGQSPLSCALWDTDDHLQTYDLFFLLTNTEFEVLSKADFMQEVRRQGREERDFEKQLLYLKIHKYVPERMNLVLGTSYSLRERPEDFHHVRVSGNFFIEEPLHTWRDKVNLRLKEQKLTCIISTMPRRELKAKLGLSVMFPVYRLKDITGSEYSVTFGQEALLLDSILFYRAAGGNEAIMA